MGAIERVKEAIEEIKKGNMVIMLDDEDRENEGDLVYAANLSTPEKVNFMATHAKGLICVSVTNDTANRLKLYPMVKDNSSSYETAFTISVDAKSALTGISAKERDDTIKILANPISNEQELVKPGHIFPLIAKEGGVLVRTGHTEGSVDLCKLAGFNGEAVICEIMKEDGTMARRDDLDIFAKKHNLKMVYISDIIEYRLSFEILVKEVSRSVTNLLNQEVEVIKFIDHLNNYHYVFNFGLDNIVNVKFHNISSDIDLFFDNKIDKILDNIKYLQENKGILVFLGNKKEENRHIKDFGIGAQILKSLNISKINLLANSKEHHFIGLNGFGISLEKVIVI